MAVRRFSTSSIKTGTKTSKFWDQSTVLTSFESIATVSVGSGGSSTITFDNIPGTYKHLQLRYIFRGTNSSNAVAGYLRFNDVSGSGNYANHILLGDGASATAVYEAGMSNRIQQGDLLANSATASAFSGTIVDILDYANTNKNKTTRTLSGGDRNGAGVLSFQSGVWLSTSAITKITLVADNGNVGQYSHFALYGIKGVA